MRLHSASCTADLAHFSLHIGHPHLGQLKYCVLLTANSANFADVDAGYLLSLHSHIFAGGWFVAGEADWDGDGLGPHHQRGLGDDHLAGLEVAGGHQVAAQLGRAAHLHTPHSQHSVWC